MKKITLMICAVFAVVLITSCKKYLTVTPKTQLPRDILFADENGFKDALTGVYIQMKSDEAYGAALTQTTVESLVSSWDAVSGSPERRLGLFDYSNAGAELALNSIFVQQYKIIAGINAILDQIDEQKTVFKTPGLYESIKAECLGLRAYCHLDLLRLFGPVPTLTNEANVLAYVTRLSKVPNALIPFNAYRDALLKDITDAAILAKNTPSVFSEPYLRMNYYAIKALEARANLWFGNTNNAYACATAVIESSGFVLGTAADMANNNYVLTREHIFGLYDFKMATKYSNLYSTGLLKKGNSALTINRQLYGSTGTDIRESSLWMLITVGNSEKCYVIKKYQNPANSAVTAETDFKQIPMLRISEMYLIAAETAPFADGLTFFKTFKTARNIGSQPEPKTKQALDTEIIKEYRKEFYAEGQAFFAYKRVNTEKKNIIFIPTAAVLNYQPPLPKSESVN